MAWVFLLVESTTPSHRKGGGDKANQYKANQNKSYQDCCNAVLEPRIPKNHAEIRETFSRVLSAFGKFRSKTKTWVPWRGMGFVSIMHVSDLINKPDPGTPRVSSVYVIGALSQRAQITRPPPKPIAHCSPAPLGPIPADNESVWSSLGPTQALLTRPRTP